MPGWFVPALAAAIFVWSFAVGITLEGRILGWYIRRAAASPGRAVLWVVGSHLITFVGWLGVLAVGSALAESHDGPRWKSRDSP